MVEIDLNIESGLILKEHLKLKCNLIVRQNS